MSAGIVLGVVIITIVSGCASSASDRLNSGLSASVASAQDSVWEDRVDFLADPEATLAAHDVYGDLRPLRADPALPFPLGSYSVIDVGDDADAVRLTLTTGATRETGGGFFYEKKHARVCFTLVLPRRRAEIETIGSDCTDRAGRDLADIFSDTKVSIVPLAQLEVDALVTAADHKRLPCQCLSGGTCDCPGG